MRLIRLETIGPPATRGMVMLLLGLSPTWAGAQVPDHLQCHKIKDSQKFKFADVTLTATQAPFQMPAGCTIKGKAKKFCVPVEKAVTDTDAPGGSIGDGQDLNANDYLCYKMKCPKTTIADTLTTDQFGTRDVVKIKTAKELCVPAVKGTVTTTTVPAESCTVGQECSVGPVCLPVCQCNCTNGGGWTTPGECIVISGGPPQLCSTNGDCQGGIICTGGTCTGPACTTQEECAGEEPVFPSSAFYCSPTVEQCDCF